ncbi:hypothetical protein ACIRRA_30655 [Nocardia sp. NPDC101769]|uniref:hypothetical protein n=1 Tax=Nocardia sp. NPDC101769 TaxID=3364333 RepID=UPI0038185A03
MASDHLLAAVLDVLAEVDPAEMFDRRDVLRAVRPAVDPAPGLDDVDEVLALLALPMLGGVVVVYDGVYRTGAAAEIVVAGLQRLADAVRVVDDEDLADRY